MNIKTIAAAILAFGLCSTAQAGGLMTLTYYSSAHDFDCGVVNPGQIIVLELGVIDPVNPSFDGGAPRAVQNIGGFECRLVPQPGVVILGVEPAVPAVVLPITDGLSVGFAQPVPVVQPGKTVLASVEILLTDETGFPLPEELTMPCYMSFNSWIEVVPSIPASIPGEVSFLDADDPSDPLVPAWRNEGPDFKFTLLAAEEVDADRNSWGGIKALYR